MHVCTQGANIETTYLYASCSRGIFFRFRRLWYTAKTSDWMFREGEKRRSSRGESVPRSFCTNSKGRFALTSRTVYTQSTNYAINDYSITTTIFTQIPIIRSDIWTDQSGWAINYPTNWQAQKMFHSNHINICAMK